MTTVVESEYREAVRVHGEDAAFRELEKLYRKERRKREGN